MMTAESLTKFFCVIIIALIGQIYLRSLNRTRLYDICVTVDRILDKWVNNQTQNALALETNSKQKIWKPCWLIENQRSMREIHFDFRL